MNSQFANIPRYFVYTALKGFGFGLITAIWVIYLQQRRGLSLTQATQSLMFTILVAISEPILGFIADQSGTLSFYRFCFCPRRAQKQKQ